MSLPASPKPTNSEELTNTNEPTQAETPLQAGETTNPETAISAVKEKSKRKSERSKPKQAEIIAVNFEAAGGVSTGLVTAHPKPAKRLNAKERAKADAKDGIRPDMKAKAKSKAEAKAKRDMRKKDKKDHSASEPLRSE